MTKHWAFALVGALVGAGVAVSLYELTDSRHVAVEIADEGILTTLNETPEEAWRGFLLAIKTDDSERFCGRLTARFLRSAAEEQNEYYVKTKRLYELAIKSGNEDIANKIAPKLKEIESYIHLPPDSQCVKISEMRPGSNFDTDGLFEVVVNSDSLAVIKAPAMTSGVIHVTLVLCSDSVWRVDKVD